MCESKLEGARELVDEFKARLQVRRRNKNEHGQNDGAAGGTAKETARGDLGDQHEPSRASNVTISLLSIA
jgi:hypothetical protein